MRMLVLVSGFLTVLNSTFAQQPPQPRPLPAASQPVPEAPRKLVFCFWNVENLFDDKDDKRRDIDEIYDNPFAENAKLRNLKYDRLVNAILKMNGGKGPDILACAEVESVRACEMLMGALNAKITDPTLKYKNFLMRNLNAGRHISTCVITRVDVSNLQTKLLGNGQRILETHLYANGHELCVVATHWTSQLKQESGGNGRDGRNSYATNISKLYEKLAEKKPNVDFLVCGDFNETPDADAVKNTLHAMADRSKLIARAADPVLLDLFAGKDPNKFGTHFYNNRPLIYDHICISPGLIDGDGWACDPDSAQTFTEGLIRPGSTRRQPWRFGNPDDNMKDSDRGFSDHFPVLVNLTVQPKKLLPPPPVKKP